jgi:hypothetical protein
MFTDANLKISSETFFCNSLNADGLCLNRSIAISTPDVNLSAENVISGINSETMENQDADIYTQNLPEHFVQWVNHGDTFWY